LPHGDQNPKFEQALKLLPHKINGNLDGVAVYVAEAVEFQWIKNQRGCRWVQKKQNIAPPNPHPQ
jgi:hypothetical protein